MTAWRRICGGYYISEDDRHIKIGHHRHNYRNGYAKRWYVYKSNPRNGYEHPDWSKPYRTLAEAQEAAG